MILGQVNECREDPRTDCVIEERKCKNKKRDSRKRTLYCLKMQLNKIRTRFACILGSSRETSRRVTANWLDEAGTDGYFWI